MILALRTPASLSLPPKPQEHRADEAALSAEGKLKLPHRKWPIPGELWQAVEPRKKSFFERRHLRLARRGRQQLFEAAEIGTIHVLASLFDCGR